MSISSVDSNEKFQNIKKHLALGYRVCNESGKDAGQSRSVGQSFFGTDTGDVDGSNKETLHLAALSNYEATGEVAYKYRDSKSQIQTLTLDFDKLEEDMSKGIHQETIENAKHDNFFTKAAKITGFVGKQLAETLLISRDSVGRISLPWTIAKIGGTVAAAALFTPAMALGATVLGAGFPLAVTIGFGALTAHQIFNGMSKIAACKDTNSNEYYNACAETIVGGLGAFALTGTKWIPGIGRLLKMEGEFGRALNVSRNGMRHSQVALEQMAGIASDTGSTSSLKYFGPLRNIIKRIKGWSSGNTSVFNQPGMSNAEVKALRLAEYRLAQSGHNALSSAKIMAAKDPTFRSKLAHFLESNTKDYDPANPDISKVKDFLSRYTDFLTPEGYGSNSISADHHILIDTVTRSPKVEAIAQKVISENEAISRKAYSGYFGIRRQINWAFGGRYISRENRLAGVISHIEEAGTSDKYHVYLETNNEAGYWSKLFNWNRKSDKTVAKLVAHIKTTTMPNGDVEHKVTSIKRPFFSLLNWEPKLAGESGINSKVAIAEVCKKYPALNSAEFQTIPMRGTNSTELIMHNPTNGETGFFRVSMRPSDGSLVVHPLETASEIRATKIINDDGLFQPLVNSKEAVKNVAEDNLLKYLQDTDKLTASSKKQFNPLSKVVSLTARTAYSSKTVPALFQLAGTMKTMRSTEQEQDSSSKEPTASSSGTNNILSMLAKSNSGTNTGYRNLSGGVTNFTAGFLINFKDRRDYSSSAYSSAPASAPSPSS